MDKGFAEYIDHCWSSCLKASNETGIRPELIAAALYTSGVDWLASRRLAIARAVGIKRILLQGIQYKKVLTEYLETVRSDARYVGEGPLPSLSVQLGALGSSGGTDILNYAVNIKASVDDILRLQEAKSQSIN